jgi:exonuclease SbcC
MQTYAIRMHNFMRFGEKGNSIVFDLTPQEKKQLKDNTLTMDQIYDRVMSNPIQHISDVKRRGIERIMAIAGIIDGNQDFSNGAGKSTLMEAMCYSRYERVARKTAQNPNSVEKAGLTVVTKIDGKYPSNMKESWVEELTEISGKIYRIRRGREFSKNHKSHSPIMIVDCLSDTDKDGIASHRKSDIKDSLDQILTTDYDIFVNSQMFAQNDAGKYLIGTDKTKKEMLISLLRLENIVLGCLENIRKKKNAQDKKIDAIKATIDLIEKSLCKKYRELTSKSTEYLDNGIVLEINAALAEIISTASANIKALEQKIHTVDTQISDLSKSEKLQKVESIREEGRRVSKDKKAKEQAMSDQIADWEKLSKESQDNLSKKIAQEKNTQEKISRLSRVKLDIEKVVKEFDLAKHQEQLAKVAKAKQLKPQIEKSLSEARKSLQEASNECAVLNNLLKRLDLDLQKLKKNGSGFICPECHNQVTEEHISSVINGLTDTIAKQTVCKTEANNKAEVESKNVADLESKSSRINDVLMSEANILASIKSFEDSKLKLTDLEAQMKDRTNDLEIIKIEKTEIGNSITTYSNRISEVRKSFEDEINIFKSKIDQLVKQLKQAEEDAQSVNNQLVMLKNQRRDLESQKNKTIELYGSSVKDEAYITGQISEWNNKRKEYEVETKHLHRLLILEDVYGLDGIQTRIVKKYLPLLNVYIKEFLDVLSDGAMAVKMIINDKGKIDMVISGGTSEIYEMLSGGEKTIVRLAVDIGLSLLAFSRTTQKPEMICLDEVFGSLDAGRTRNVFKILNKLSDKFNRIIIISHDAEINNQIKTKIIIEKNGGRMGLSEIKRIE